MEDYIYDDNTIMEDEQNGDPTNVYQEDINGDGQIDLVYAEHDTDGDGIADHVEAYMDEDFDGTFEKKVELYDFNQDGMPEVIAQSVDTNSDGNYDYMQVQTDMDGDGIIDAVEEMVDTNNNGVYDKHALTADTSGDGQPDYIEVDTDYNEDGAYDSARIYQDTDHNGNIDTMTDVYDSDGDGRLDRADVHHDYDEDGKDDWAQHFAFNPGTGELTPLDDAPGYGEGLAGTYAFELEQYEPAADYPAGISGDPATSIEHWEYQGDTGRCALYSQKFIVEEFTGQDIDIEEFVEVAEENGWFDGTTTFLNTNKMLDYYGIDNEMSFHNDINDIEQCLEAGGRIIVAIDADEIWYGQGDDLFSPTSAANHAVEVVGIDRTDPDKPMVILNDSGTPNGKGEMVPLDDFIDAWQDSECQMIECYPNK